jgi:putative thioredoxin
MAQPVEVTDADFQERVLDRSAEVTVLVDFWADWCRPCHMLAPVIERAVDAQAGKVELAKLDTDSNQATAARYGIRGLPTVKAFRNGQVVDEFTGAQPPPVVERFVAGLVPSEADELAEAGGEESLRQALAADPNHAVARRELARILVRRGESAEALELLEGVHGDFEAEGMKARAQLGDPQLAGDGALAAAFEAWDGGDQATALAQLEAALIDPERRDPDRRDAIRRVMVAIFTELGPENELARDYRRRLSAALY